MEREFIGVKILDERGNQKEYWEGPLPWIYAKKNTPKELANIMCINAYNNDEVLLHQYNEILKSASVIDKVKYDISELEKYIERHFLSLAKIEGFTIQDAIDNPVILEQFKKRGS